MNYRTLFELNIFHDYYQNKVCPDFSIEPTTECSRILNGHRLIVKNKVNGIMVIVPVETEDTEDPEQKPLVELADNLQFTFILKPKNKDFIDFTAINWNPFEDLIYQFSNENNTQIGVSDLAITPIELSERQLPRGQNIFGIVDIYNNASMPKVLDRWSEYQITFEAKRQQWCYYLVANNGSGTNGDVFEIKDTTEEIEFEEKKAPFEAQEEQIFSVLKQRFTQSQQSIF